MKIGPLESEGTLTGIRIDIEYLEDWQCLEMIALDVVLNNKPPSHQFSKHMRPDDDWKEYVMPEIDEKLNSQVLFVNGKIEQEKAQDREEPSVTILSADAAAWYGAINQARLALESHYRLSLIQDEEYQSSSLSGEVIYAAVRNNVYTYIQSQLLDHAMV